LTQNGSTPDGRDRAGKRPSAGRPDQSWLAGWVETFKTVAYAIVLAVVVRTFAYEPFHIPSGSMIPTLLIGDYLFVSKFSYGYSKYSFPFFNPNFDGRFWNSTPERGDVVVFKLPKDNKTDYIKRLVGLPGDRIQVLSGVLHINGEPVELEQLKPYPYDDRIGGTVSTRQYLETFTNGNAHRIIDQGYGRPLDNTEVYVVPDRHYFFMGDNRDGSLDSRVLSDVGFVPEENLVGRAEILFYSTDGSAELWEVWKWPFAMRFSRFGNRL